MESISLCIHQNADMGLFSMSAFGIFRQCYAYGAADSGYMCATIALAKPEQLTSVAPLMRRAKS